MVHLFKRLGYNIAVDTASASVHVLDDVAYEAVSLYGKMPDEELIAAVSAKCGVTADDAAECLSDIRELVSAGTLFSEDKFRPDVSVLAISSVPM